MNPITRIKIDVENAWEQHRNNQWNNNDAYYVVCSVCGEELHSYKDIYCPEMCGWERLAGTKRWICHSCLGHHSDHWRRKTDSEIVAERMERYPDSCYWCAFYHIHEGYCKIFARNGHFPTKRCAEFMGREEE